MFVTALQLHNFRNYSDVDFHPASDGITLLVGPNGAGKTNILESIAWIALTKSFRGAPNESLVHRDTPSAQIKARLGGRKSPIDIDAVIPTSGRAKINVNNKAIRRFKDVGDYVKVVVFTPDDLDLVKGSPSRRRDFLDTLLISAYPKHEATLREYEQTLKQRNAFLSSIEILNETNKAELDVWDEQLSTTGEQLGIARQELVTQLGPYVQSTYSRLADEGNESLELQITDNWSAKGMQNSLHERRQLDVIRGTTSIGPHRDDLDLSLSSMPARQTASQGQQRSIALSLRLASHALVSDVWDSRPILLLDDIFSELDDRRAAALLRLLPQGQSILSTTGRLPDGIEPTMVVEITDARLEQVV